MDSRWFKEDRDLAKADKSKTIEEHKDATKKALKNSTLLRDRLERILNEEIHRCLLDDEDFSKPDWEREHVANISRRKALREVINLIDFK